MRGLPLTRISGRLATLRCATIMPFASTSASIRPLNVVPAFASAPLPSQLTRKPCCHGAASSRPRMRVPGASGIAAPGRSHSRIVYFASISPLGAVVQTTSICLRFTATAGPFTGQPSMRQPSECRVRGADHSPFALRASTEMSRISSGLRSRYATTVRPAKRAASVWQQLQVLASISACSLSMPARSTTALRKVIGDSCSSWPLSSWPLSPCPATSDGFAPRRPSSQITSTRSPPAGTSETKPCCVAVPSRCGMIGALQVRPRSRDRTRRMS